MKTKSYTPLAVDLPPTDTISRLNRSRPNLIAAAHTPSNGLHGSPQRSTPARRRRPARSAEHAGEAANRPFPSAKPKLDRAKRRGGRGESIGWVSYRRNEAQERGHGDGRKYDGGGITVRNCLQFTAARARLLTGQFPPRWRTPPRPGFGHQTTPQSRSRPWRRATASLSLFRFRSAGTSSCGQGGLGSRV